MDLWASETTVEFYLLPLCGFWELNSDCRQVLQALYPQSLENDVHKKDFQNFYFHLCICNLYVCCMPLEVRRGSQIPWN